MVRRPMGDVVVVIPGILGSELMKNGVPVWSMTAGAAWNALKTLGGSLQDLALEGDDPDLDDLGDGVTASRVLPDLHLIPGLWTIDGYSKIAAAIQEAFDVTPGENYFEFPYDWRRDNRVAGRKLRRQSDDWLRGWQERSGNSEAKLILLCHSMGGLVARDFLERHDGWRDTRSLITFGTPFRGSVNALNTLSRGSRHTLGPITLIDLTDLARSLTSIYQLLPIYPMYDAGDGALVRVGETTGIPGVDAEMAAEALRFHHEIRDLVEEHRNDAAYRDRGYGIHPIIGFDQPTLQSAILAGDTVRFSRSYPGEEMYGDGTVPAVSAVPLEHSSGQIGTYSSEKHSSLQNATPMLAHVRGLLTASRTDLERFQAPPPMSPRLGLDVDDVVDAASPVSVKVKAHFGSPTLNVTITNADTERPQPMPSRSAIDDSGWTMFEAAPLDPGIYRVRAASDAGAETVTAVIVSLPQ